ncbi:hypothetical protein SZN_00760 [Streptomyces zinciresistens K42]|uniref:Uncharacterized protein n=1 Tax=Streptomyces zinciresistens K42 TaxID=700597 RepID=G2G3V1_9ACTN|nr:hypothetical protein [Streptomyces zinciresistens]EGX61847.1 hypothetical protein SZN_00760 [Streptomyces zinciresistens K42]
MDDDLLQQIEKARFPSSWVGSIAWAQALIRWHFILSANAWAEAEEDLGADQDELTSVVTAVLAAALHATAIKEGLDAPDGARLLQVPLQPMIELVTHPDRDVLRQAVPEDNVIWPQAPELLEVILTPKDPDGLAVQGAVTALTNRVIRTHASHGETVGERLRTIPDLQQAIERLESLPYPVNESGVPALAQPVGGLSLDAHRRAAESLKAHHRVQQIIGDMHPALSRELLLVRAALLDRIVLAFADYASAEQQDNARATATALREHDARSGLWRGDVPPMDSRWDDVPQRYVRQEFLAYLSRTTAGRQTPARSGHVTSVHLIEVPAHHTLPAQFRNHPCGRGRHRHDYRIRIEVVAPLDVLTEDASARLRTTAAALERAEGPLWDKDLERLDGGVEAGTDERWLAGWVHQWVDAQLPPGLGEHLLVEVEAIDLASIPAVHLGKAR